MKKYKCEADIKNILFQISSKLALIEVKGDSVETLFASRFMLKELFEEIEEVEDGV